MLGPGFTFLDGNDGNYHVSDTLWHADMGWDPHIPEGRTDPNRADSRWRGHYMPAIKVGLYLDPVSVDTGCLRVIPGSHRSPHHEEFWSLHSNIPSYLSELERVHPKLQEMWERDTGSLDGWERLASDPRVNHFGLDPSDIPAYPIESRPGDAVFFSYQLWHSSFGGHAGRRMFTLNFRGAQSEDGE